MLFYLYADLPRAAMKIPSEGKANIVGNNTRDKYYNYGEQRWVPPSCCR